MASLHFLNCKVVHFNFVFTYVALIHRIHLHLFNYSVMKWHFYRWWPIVDPALTIAKSSLKIKRISNLGWGHSISLCFLFPFTFDVRFYALILFHLAENVLTSTYVDEMIFIIPVTFFAYFEVKYCQQLIGYDDKSNIPWFDVWCMKMHKSALSLNT